MKRLCFLLAIGTILSGSVSAQESSSAKLLLPINVDLVQGLFQTVWLTDLAVANHGTLPLRVLGYDPEPCASDNCASPPIPPHGTIFTPYVRCSGGGGRLLLVDRARLSDVAATLRTRDTTREDQTWGTTIPVVPDTAMFATTFSLVNVPMDSRFRSTLRLYDIDPSSPPAVTVRFYRIINMFSFGTSDVLIRTLEPTFITTPGIAACGAIAEIHLWEYPDLVAAAQLRIEIIPLDGRKEYWGFASVTHNDTQHVTVISPNP